ncbi:MAG: hypothetical protein MHPSP_004439, partial [Paramarteilia canceri]
LVKTGLANKHSFIALKSYNRLLLDCEKLHNEIIDVWLFADDKGFSLLLAHFLKQKKKLKNATIRANFIVPSKMDNVQLEAFRKKMTENLYHIRIKADIRVFRLVIFFP